MKKLYSYTCVYFAVFICLHFNIFAKTTDDQPVILKSTPVKALPVRFKPLPFKPMYLNKVDLYKFDQKAYVFGKITSAFPVLTAQEWQTVSNDPVRFTLTPNKESVYVGEEIELTLTAELLNISPSAMFTFEELRNYTIKVVLPNDFIQTGGTYYDFISDKLDGGSTKKIYTIKGRYLAKPALDDCFKVLRKLNNEVFILKATQCPTITEVDFASLKSEKQSEKTREIAAIDLNKVNYFNSFNSSDGNQAPLSESQLNILLNCYKWTDHNLMMTVNSDGVLHVLDNGGSLYWEITQKVGNVIRSVRHVCDRNTTGFSDRLRDSTTSITAILKIYSTNVCPNSVTVPTATPIYSKTTTYTIDRTSNCPQPPTNFTISATSTAICSGNSSTLEASSNCPSTNVSWKKGGNPYGGNSSFLEVSEAGSYQAFCSNPVMTSGSIVINVSTIPPNPTVTSDKNALTPGEFAQLTASNCSGTILWTGPNNFADVGNQISVNKEGGYNAKCKTTCIQNNVATDYYSGLSATINIAVAPLRIQADKSQIRPGESVTVTAYGCTNGYIKWKINDNLQNTSSNPFTFNSSGYYSASCNSWDGTYTSGWVTIFVHQLPANTPTIAANKLRAYNNESVALTATGCTTYYWVIPVRQPNGSYSTPNPVASGSGWTATGPASYSVGCTNSGPWAYVTVYQLQPGDITISSNKQVAASGEAVELTIGGDCPSTAGIQWRIAGENSWTTRNESKTVYGAGIFEARCIIDDLSYGNWASKTINAPAPGGITISASKTSAAETEQVTLRANGCEGEVIWTWTLNQTPPITNVVRGTSLLFTNGPSITNGPITYTAQCARFGITGAPATIVIQPKNNAAPRFYATQPVASGNQIFELVAENCPNNYVQWGVPKQDANGNTYYDYANFFPTLIVRGPGTYQVRCNEGNYTSFQDIVVFASPSDALTIVANKSKALPTESVTLKAFGCPNGVVNWEIGGNIITGVQYTTSGPGTYKARCIGDPTNNGDYAVATIIPNGSIVPTITVRSGFISACPGESITLDAGTTADANSCPASWPIQWQVVKDTQIEYWLNNRNAIENFGENYGDVFEFVFNTSITKAGPRIYYARCMKPDGTWLGEFKDKSYIVEPVFPEYLRASNNGPALMGATGIRVAVTEVPQQIGTTQNPLIDSQKIKYAWAGPNSFTSTERNPLVNNLTEAKSGIYTITVTKGLTTPQCIVTATTNLTVSGCSDIRIKVINPSNGYETNKIPLTSGSVNQYEDLALSVETLRGEPLPSGFLYNWSFNLGTLSNPTNPYIVTNKSGIYSVVVKPNSTATGCKVYSILQEDEPLDERWDKAILKNFASGVSVTVVPIEPYGYNISSLPNAKKAKLPRIRLLNYVLNNVKRQDLMLIFPYESYLTANNYRVTSNNFSGSVLFFEKESRAYLGGWRYRNGSPIRRIPLRFENSVASCTGWVVYPKSSCACSDGFSILYSDNISDINDYLDRHQLELVATFKYDCGDNAGGGRPDIEFTSTDPAPPIVDGPADPNSKDFGDFSWIDATAGTGGSGSNTQTPGSLNNADDVAFELTLLRENIRRGISEIIDQAANINGTSTGLTPVEVSLLIKLLDKAINNSLGLSINSNAQAANIITKILENNFYGAAGTIIPDNLTLPPLTYSDALTKLLNQKESILNSLRAIVNIRLAVGENTASSIVNNYQSMGKDITKVLVNLWPNIFAQKNDIQGLWTSFGGSLPTSNPITTTDGVTITFTPWVANHPAKITFKKGDNEISIFAFTNVDIKNNDITNPCLKTLTNIIKNDQIKADIQKLIAQDFKDFGEDQNIVFKENSSLSGPGQTSMHGSSNVEAWIELNPNLISSASKEYGISVILHECLHASLNISGVGTGRDNEDHFVMIRNGLPLLIDGLVDAAGWNKSDPDQYKNAAALTLGGFANVFIINPALYNSIAAKYQLNETSVSNIQGSFKNRSLGTPCN